jgi:arabinofuranan 3-O-arabinosyltransferase
MSAPEGRVAVAPWGGFVPDRLVLNRTDRSASTTTGARSVEVAETSTGSLSAEVGPGAAGLLTLPQNANPGWRATFDGRPLDPVTVDGWKQGFVVPGGGAGTVAVTFGPDGPYRWGLLLGLVLVLLVAASALTPSRQRAGVVTGSGATAGTARVSVRGRWSVHARVRAGSGSLVALLLGFLLAGWWGALVAAPCLLLTAGPWVQLPLRVRSVVVSGLVAGLVTVAGLVQAWWAPGRLGGPALEGTLRLLCVAALVLVSASWRAPGPSADARPDAR